MITDSDTEFHARDASDVTWTETNFLPFIVPEAGVFGNVYVLARPNVGVATSSILVGQGLCRQPFEIDFTDPQVHLPCPESFSDYTLANGLSVTAPNPRDYRFSYENRLGACAFELRFEGLHQPFDPGDPAENPLLASDRAGSDARRGDAWENGHYEVKGHITGELQLRGRRYEVDCYEGMDHSWGPRTELGTRAVAWLSVNFEAELAMHLAMLIDVRSGEITYERPRFGFVVERGEVRPIVEATVQATHLEMLVTGNHILATDVDGREYEFFGTTISGHPWYSFNPCHVSFQSILRYRWGDRTGHGEMADIFGLDYLADRLSRHARLGAGDR